MVVDDVRSAAEDQCAGKGGVRDEVEVLGPERRHVAKGHAAVGVAALADVIGAAEHGDLMPAVREPGAKLLDVALDPALRGGYAAQADEGDPKLAAHAGTAAGTPLASE